MVSQLLLYKILQLFFMLGLGFLLVKTKIIKGIESKVLSKLSLYLFMPAVIINCFSLDMTESIIKGLLLAFFAAIIIHIVLLCLDIVCKKILKGASVERASVIYSNAGNLIIPIVTFVLGEKWVIYSCAFLVVQIVFMWTHGLSLFSDDENFDFRKIFLNVNMIAIYIGFAMLLFNFKLPVFVKDITSELGNMLGPVGMIITGMLAADMDFKKALIDKRIYVVAFFRMIICPLLMFVLLKIILSLVCLENADSILLVSYLACITPSASTITQFAQIYNKDTDFAVAINIVTTLVCIITMPLFVHFFNMI